MGRRPDKKLKKKQEKKRIAKQKRHESYYSFKKGASAEQKAYGKFLLYFLGFLVVGACGFAFYSMT